MIILVSLLSVSVKMTAPPPGLQALEGSSIVALSLVACNAGQVPARHDHPKRQ